jgi:hypothetical protein
MGRRTYLLGAGASAAATENIFPVMSNFFNHEKITTPEKGYKELYDFLASFVGAEEEIIRANMEEVITHLETSLNGYGRDWGVATPTELGRLETVRKQFFSYLHERLQTPKQLQDEGPYLYQRLLQDFDQSSDSILTLNYDLLMDVAITHMCLHMSPQKETIDARSKHILSKSGLQFGTQIAYPGRFSSGLYLKLHGSLDWLTCPNAKCVSHTEISHYAINSNFPLIGEPCYRCGHAVIPVIVPPTMQKNLSIFPKLGLIWNLAMQKLKAADEIVLVGISLPESDYYLRWLLREATRTGKGKTITLVTKDPEGQARNRAKSIFGRSGGRKQHKLLFCNEVEEFLSGSLEPIK